MAGSLTNSWETFMLDVLLGSDTASTRETVLALVGPRSRFLALLVGDVSATYEPAAALAGTGTLPGEVQGGSYSRQVIPATGVINQPATQPAWSQGVSGNATTHVNTVTYAFAGMPACTVTGFAVCLGSGRPAAASAGSVSVDEFDPILYGTLTAAVVVAANSVVVFPPGSLVITLD